MIRRRAALGRAGAHNRRPKEVFVGPRLAVVVEGAARARSALFLLVVSIFLGLIMAGALATATWYLVQAVVNALGNGTS